MPREARAGHVRRNVLAAVISQCLIAGAHAGGATINVDDGAVADMDDGECSIVEAIINANAGDQSGSVDCTAGTGAGDIVNLPTGGTFVFTEAVTGGRALPTITTRLTISGRASVLPPRSGRDRLRDDCRDGVRRSSAAECDSQQRRDE